MERRDNMRVWVHMHVLQPVLLPVSSGQRSDYAVNLHHSVPAERDVFESPIGDRWLEVPWRR